MHYFILLAFKKMNPVNSLFLFMGFLGVAFLLLVVFLDSNDNFALKRDWRDQVEKKDNEI